MMNNLPPNWSWVKLGDVCKVKGGFAFKSKEYKKEGVPLVRISNIEDMKISLEDCVYIQSDNEEKIKEFILHKGDILIALSGATTGKYGIYNHDRKAFLNQRIGRLHFNGSDKILPVFIYLYLEIIRSKILQTAYGAAQPNISPSEISDFPIPLPPLPEQKKIVEKIEELFRGLDNGVASLKKAKAQLRLYRQSVLAFAFSGRLVGEVGSRQLAVGKIEMLKAAEPQVDYKNNGLPEGWKWVKLGDVIESIQYGTSDKANGSEKGIPVLRMGNIQDGKLDYSNLKYFDKNYEDLNKYILADGDLLFNRTNSAELVGKSALYKRYHPKSIFASYLIRVKVNKSIYSSEFLNYYINSSYGRAFIKSVVSQNVGQANVNGTKLKSMSVPMIPLNQQTQIVEEIEKRFSEADNLEKAIDDSLEKSEALRQSILKQAFKGRLI
jgi:type I restriction enzyme S subunit